MVSNNESINVKKRNGRGLEKLDIEKIHAMVEYACEDITGVSSSQVEMNSGLQFYDGISKEEIQQIMIKSASDFVRHSKLYLRCFTLTFIQFKKTNISQIMGPPTFL